MVLAVYCDRSERDRIIYRLRDTTYRPRFTGDWRGFRRALEEAGHGLVVDRDATLRTVDRVQSLKTRYPDTPLVLATPVEALSWRHLKDLRVEELVALEQLDHELRAALERADGEAVFYAVRDRLGASARLHESLGRTLGAAVVRRPPYGSVRALCEDAEVNRRTLWHHWSSVMGPGDDPGLKGFLDWVILLRAAVERTGRRSWRRVGEELGVPLRTLRRVVRRRLDLPLHRLDGLRRERLLDRFEEEVLGRLAP